MSATNYIRGISDYTFSLHQLHAQATGHQYPKFSSLINVNHCTESGWRQLITEVKQALLDNGFNNFSEYTQSYDSPEDKTASLATEQVYLQFNKIDEFVSIETYFKSKTASIILLADNKNVVDLLNPIITKFRDEFKKTVTNKNKFYTICEVDGRFAIETMEILPQFPEDHIGWHYNASFGPVNESILDSIDSNKNGLVLLHGVPGSGKTNYIKYLISRAADRKIFYIPPHLAASISNPSFISFVRKNMSNCVMVIEDAENILHDREGTGDSTAVSNLLNVSDGILGDALNILIIATFNSSRDHIDKALLRKGRMLCEYYFTELSADKTNELINKLYPDAAEDILSKLPKKSLTLADVYNINVNQFTQTKKSVKMGFVNGD